MWYWLKEGQKRREMWSGKKKVQQKINDKKINGDSATESSVNTGLKQGKHVEWEIVIVSKEVVQTQLVFPSFAYLWFALQKAACRLRQTQSPLVIGHLLNHITPYCLTFLNFNLVHMFRLLQLSFVLCFSGPALGRWERTHTHAHTHC